MKFSCVAGSLGALPFEPKPVRVVEMSITAMGMAGGGGSPAPLLRVDVTNEKPRPDGKHHTQ